MIIIAEKLNGSIPSCRKAIAERDSEYIKDMAKRQADAGSDFIDCCASVESDEFETLKWMIDAIQSVTDCPISVDSPDVQVIIDAMELCKKPGLFNSVSAEGNKIDRAFPILAKPENSDWQVMALLCGDYGIPKTAKERIDIFEQIMAKAQEYGIEDKRIHIDPLVEMLCTIEEGGASLILEVMNHIKKTHPEVNISGAISNVSFNLPVRRLINQAFMVLTMNAGMTSVVLDPLSSDLRGMIYATQALLGNDDYCLEYIGAFREGIFK